MEAQPGARLRFAPCATSVTPTCAGSTAFAVVSSNAVCTVSRSTAFRSRELNAPTSASASYRARLKRRSTRRWKPPAQRVVERGRSEGRGRDADRGGERQHARRQQHEPHEHEQERAGQQCVRERAADQPVDLVEAVLQDPDADRNRDAEQARVGDGRDHTENAGLAGEHHGERSADGCERTAAEEPLQLRAAGTGRASVGGDAADEPGEGDHDREDEEDDLRERPPAPEMGRMVDPVEIAGRLDRDLALGDHLHGDRERPDSPDRARDPEDPYDPPPPASRRQRAVREEQHREHEQEDRGGPHRLEEHEHRPERQVIVAPVDVDRIAPGDRVDRQAERGANQRPADRVARLVAGDDHPDGGEGDGQEHGADPHRARVVGEVAERQGRGEEQQHHDAERSRDPGRGNAIHDGSLNRGASRDRYGAT